ncbi:hypothetical protein HMPREF0971_00895 [Segatella oris F0302]|uniref:Uncharacterized protein n=1 Tax=Segatella oris F0302 TaxID=649760 RepID=D1QPK4_9BACT|nr:hypothetical protein HMPREF0971_00895 [Segatella oris F0302]
MSFSVFILFIIDEKLNLEDFSPLGALPVNKSVSSFKRIAQKVFLHYFAQTSKRE